MRRLGARPGNGDEGAAMVMVLGVASVMVLLAASMVVYAVGTHRNARAGQDWNVALAAAYAGVEEYQSRLANNPDYFAWGNPASPYTSASGSVVTMPTGAAANPAFSVSASPTEWATVPDGAGAPSGDEASFRYEVDNSRFYLEGTLRLRSTGRAQGETRTIVADLRQAGFLDYLYFSDYGIRDPALTGITTPECVPVRYAHGMDPRNAADQCGEVAFATGDVLDGPVHSNDIIRACGTQFLGPVTTAYNPPTGKRYRSVDYAGNSCSTSYFAMNDGGPAYQPTLGMPQTNTELRVETRHDLPLRVPRPGCLYTGPTKITLLPNGNMQIVSPWTKYTSASPSPTKQDHCGTPGPSGMAKTKVQGLNRWYVGEEIPIPDNNVIYVQDVPSMTSDPNYSPPGHSPTGVDQVSCANDSANNVGFPYKSGSFTEVTPHGSTAASPAYGCRNGDVFVEGTLDGHLTIAGENYVYITGDIQYENPDDDILGLIGNDAVLVWNPVRMQGSNYRTMLTDNGRRIDAAILSVAHSFAVQNYGRGSRRGALNINGSLAQKFRSIVQGGSSGYDIAYVYDQRLKYTSPPKFLSPVTTTYNVSTWAEVRPVFDADGSYR